MKSKTNQVGVPINSALCKAFGIFLWCAFVIAPTYDIFEDNLHYIVEHSYAIISKLNEKWEIDKFFERMEEISFVSDQFISTHLNEDQVKFEEEFRNGLRDGSIDFKKVCPHSTQGDLDALMNYEFEKAAKEFLKAEENCNAKKEYETAHQEQIVANLWELISNLGHRMKRLCLHLGVGVVGIFVMLDSIMVHSLQMHETVFWGNKTIVVYCILLILAVQQLWDPWNHWEQRKDYKIKYNIPFGKINLAAIKRHFAFYSYHLLVWFYMVWHQMYWLKTPELVTSQTLPRYLTKKQWRKMKKDTIDPSKFHQYCLQDSKDKVKDIIRKHQHDIDINALKDGQTALHLAVDRKFIAITRILIRNFDGKIDCTIRNQSGLNVLDLAIIRKSREMFDLILEANPKTEISSLFWAIKTDQEYFFRVLKGKVSLAEDVVGEITELCQLQDEVNAIKKTSKTKEITLERIEDLKTSISFRLQNKCPDLIRNREREFQKKFQCLSCQTYMQEPLQIFSCSKNHYHCSQCSPKMTSCLFCGENFKKHKPTRRRAAEQQLADITSQGVI